MKKFVVIIIILLIVFIGMIIYRTTAVKASDISIQEVEKIENYLNQIYLEKEIIEESLPYFEEINQADEKWIIEVIKKNVEEEEITEEQIQNVEKEVFGEEFTKEISNEEIFNNTPIEIDNQGSLFLINKIEKEQDKYQVEIIEYIEDYEPTLKEQPENYIIIRNTEGEEISRASENNKEETINIVKRNVDKFSKKKILLKEKDEKIYIQKVER